MVKRFLIKLLLEQGARIIKSIPSAYRYIISQRKQNNTTNNQNNSSNSFFNIQNILSTPMTREEALKILNLKENNELSSKLVIDQFEKYMECNNPEKGGSFYLQNKIYYAKEFLIQDYPNEEHSSKYDPNNYNKTNDEAEEQSSKEKNDKI